MTILLLCLVIVTLIGFRYRKVPEDDFMLPKNTKSLKGFFVLLVFFQHLSEYGPALNGLPSEVYSRVQFYFGQNIVALFLFLSGFGIATKISDDKGYLRTFPQKRIAKVVVDFDIAVVLYLVLSFWLKKQYPLSRILLSFIGWDQIGNSNWFIFVTLLMYTLIYVVFSIIKNINTGIVIFLACNVLYVWLFDIFKFRAEYFYNTSLCFGAGMIFKLIYPYLLTLIRKDILYIGLLVGIPGLAYFLLRYNYIVWIFNLIAALLAIWICLFNYRFKIDNPILNFFGGRVFGIYILQRIPMIVLEAIGIDEAWIYIPLCLVVTVILERAYTTLLNKIHEKMGI